jgi:AcrR family transcriptional regulator
MPNLIERRHEQTRAAIAEAAVALFTDRGFAETTMEDVAEAAGVSRRTAYRHFPSKDDLVFELPRRWLEHFNTFVADPQPGETLRDLCRRGLLAVGQLIQAHAAAIVAAYSVMLATPSLRGRNGRTEDEWFERYIQLLTPAEPLDTGRSLQIAVVAGALVGTTKTLVAVWAASQPEADMRAMTEAALDQLDPIWPDWLAHTPAGPDPAPSSSKRPARTTDRRARSPRD